MSFLMKQTTLGWGIVGKKICIMRVSFALIILLFFSIKTNYLMCQTTMTLNENGLGEISIDKKMTNRNILPIKCYQKKYQYNFGSDSSQIFFLSSPDNKIMDIGNFEDLFLVTDSSNVIKLISVFFNCNDAHLLEALKNKLGDVKFNMTSSISGNSLRRRYGWMSKSGINFTLTIRNQYSDSHKTTSSNLLIYSNDISEEIGDWIITPR